MKRWRQIRLILVLSAIRRAVLTFDDQERRCNGAGDRVAGDAFIQPCVVSLQSDDRQVPTSDRRLAIQR